jgi:hypothetical protein
MPKDKNYVKVIKFFSHQVQVLQWRTPTHPPEQVIIKDGLPNVDDV